MALLRQCLRELRVKRGEWASSDEVWCDSSPLGFEELREHSQVEEQPAPGQQVLHGDPADLQHLRD